MIHRILGSAFIASPRSVSGREGTPEELSEVMVCRILGSVLVASSQSVSGREPAPEEVSAAIVRHILGSLCCLPTICFRARGYARGVI